MTFAVQRAVVRDGLELAFVREGVGGLPLLLLHGWPETKRIWWRNVEPLAAAGFEVIVPDLRGFGDSGLAPDDRYDVAAHARDLEALLRGVLGHEQVVACAGDLGGAIVQDLSLRFAGLVERLILFNTIPPVLPDSPPRVPRATRMAADYFIRQSRDADGLAAELDTPARRRAYVAPFYGSRFWAAPGSFQREDVDFMTEPFGDAERFRASIANYEYVGGARQAPEPPRLLEVNPTPCAILYGPEDHVIPADFPQRMQAAFPNRLGPFVVPDAGHFLMWERAELLNDTLRWVCRDLLAA
ncbi:MAG TPA: alpha/beta hydrolase [Thermoleophilaceae bacterium]